MIGQQLISPRTSRHKRQFLVGLPAALLGAVAIILPSSSLEPAPAPPTRQTLAAKCGATGVKTAASTNSWTDSFRGDRPVRLAHIHARNVIAAPVIQQPSAPPGTAQFPKKEAAPRAESCSKPARRNGGEFSPASRCSAQDGGRLRGLPRTQDA
jgi:hypothetical protein